MSPLFSPRGTALSPSNASISASSPPSTKRKPSTHAQPTPCAKRQRRPPPPPPPPSICSRLSLEHLTPDVVAEGLLSPPPARRTPFCQGQFEDPDRLVVRLADDQLVCAMTALLEDACRKRAEECVECALRHSPPYRTDKFPDGSSSVFFSLSKPGIVLSKYLRRFVRYLNVSRSVFIVSLIYLDRVHESDEMLGLEELNIHRLVTTALCVAAKYLEDESHRNSSLSRIGGVPSTSEMNVLEHEFLRRLNWACAVSMEMYRVYEKKFYMALPSLSS